MAADTQQAYEQAREIALRQLTAADRSCAELRSRLVDRGVEEAVAAAVVTRFVEVGLVNDEAFARQWVATRSGGRGLSRRAIAAELRTKGIEAQTAETALAPLDSDTDRATAERLVRRKAATMAGLADDVRVRRLVGMLARKGFGPDVAYQVVRSVLADVELDPSD